MYIEKISIKSFGRLSDFETTLSEHINVFEGNNESGKSTVAEFIKFMLYGMQSRAVGERTLSERNRYINWNSALASGSMTVNADGKRILIERTLAAGTDPSGATVYKEAVKMTDVETGAQISKGKNPGELLFGVPEEVFTGTAFVRQIGGARVDGGKLSDSAENLLFSADENVNTEKSIDRLDSLRRQLLHKNGRGGTLYEKERERDEVALRLENAKRTAGELIAVETRIAGLSEKRIAAEKKRDASREKYEKYDAVQNLHRFEKFHALESELSALYTEKEELLTKGLVGGHFPDVKYVSDLQSVSDGMAVTSASIAAVSRQLEDVRRERGSEADIERCRALAEGDAAAEKILDEAEKKRSRKKGGAIASAVLLITSVILLAVYFLFEFGIFGGLPETVILMSGIIGAVMLPVGTVMLIMFMRSSSELKKMLSLYGADSYEELSEKLSGLSEAYEKDKQLASQINALETELYVKYSAYDDEVKRASRLLALRGITVNADEIPEKVRNVLEETEAICEKERNIASKIEAGRREANETERELHGTDESEIRRITEGLDIAEYDKMPYSQLKLEREFNENVVIRLTETIHELEIKRTQLLSQREDPSELAVKLDGIVSELAHERERYNACILAMETLSKAKESVRSSVVPRIRDGAKGYMSRITNGKYTEIGVDGGFSMTVDADGAYRELEYMSEGTSDSAYLSLRLALIDVLYRKTLPPLVFDEAFARLDDERTVSAMKLLSENNSSVEFPQALIFTCQKREGIIAERIASESSRVIKL